MKNPINNNTYFNLIQPKIFNLLQYHISEDDPVRKLSAILVDMDFTKLLKVFSYKTKVHPVRMFAIILYAYSRGIYSTRDIENACLENIKFRFLLQDSTLPDHSTISRFLNKIEHLLPDLFEQFIKKIFKMEDISTDNIYIDGTKIEAYILSFGKNLSKIIGINLMIKFKLLFLISIKNLILIYLLFLKFIIILKI